MNVITANAMEKVISIHPSRIICTMQGAMNLSNLTRYPMEMYLWCDAIRNWKKPEQNLDWTFVILEEPVKQEDVDTHNKNRTHSIDGYQLMFFEACGNKVNKEFLEYKND